MGCCGTACLGWQWKALSKHPQQKSQHVHLEDEEAAGTRAGPDWPVDFSSSWRHRASHQNFRRYGEWLCWVTAEVSESWNQLWISPRKILVYCFKIILLCVGFCLPQVLQLCLHQGGLNQTVPLLPMEQLPALDSVRGHFCWGWARGQAHKD